MSLYFIEMLSVCCFLLQFKIRSNPLIKETASYYQQKNSILSLSSHVLFVGFQKNYKASYANVIKINRNMNTQEFKNMPCNNLRKVYKKVFV